MNSLLSIARRSKTVPRRLPSDRTRRLECGDARTTGNGLISEFHFADSAEFFARS
jgi:hypothetical protein